MSNLKNTVIAAGLALAFASAAFAQGSSSPNPGKRTDSAPSTGTTSESSPKQRNEGCSKLTGEAKDNCLRGVAPRSDGGSASSSGARERGPGSTRGPGASPNTTKPN